MFAAYRRDDFADPDTFLIQLGMVLERYSDTVVDHVTHPATGIQRKSKFPPSIAEVVEMCAAEVAHAERVRRYQEMGSIRPTNYERPTAPGRRANLFVAADAPRYAEMVEKSNTADPADWRWDETRAGIWVALTWWHEGAKTTAAAARAVLNKVSATEVLEDEMA